MPGLRVLITNFTLASLTGSETYVRDLALGLLHKGHTPIVYSPELGQIAEELRQATVPVVDSLDAVATAPDVIHGNHNADLMTALLHFPSVPAVFFCHSWTEWLASPPVHPRIKMYVAVDETCRDRLQCEHGIAEERLRVFLNPTDLERFKPRGPLPERPRRALVFSNNATTEHSHLGTVREACHRAGIELEVIGSGVNTSTSRPELVLGKYDLVFAKARCALESLAIGAAVILCDACGSGPLVTTDELERLQRLNFGIRTLREKLDADLLLREIARYDLHDAAEVSRRIRATAGLEAFIDNVLELYREIIAEHSSAAAEDPLVESRAAAAYLRWQTITVRRKQREFEKMMADSLTLRLRHQIARFPLLDRPLHLLAHIARRNGK
jgi:Glycosyltransferase Family 4